MKDEPDYVTINPTTNAHKFNVVIMHHLNEQDGYVVKKCSQPLNRIAADALAQSWAAACRIEIR